MYFNFSFKFVRFCILNVFENIYLNCLQKTASEVCDLILAFDSGRTVRFQSV